MRKRTDRAGTTPLARVAACALAACVTFLVLSLPCRAEKPSRPEPTAAEMERATELVARVIERYESERSYRIRFTQESYWALADTTISTTGVIILERPSKLSVRYDDGSMIASRGDTLTVYMSQTNQYFITRMGKDDTVIDPARVLRSFAPDPAGPFSGAFEVVVNGPGRPDWFERTVEATLLLLPTEGTAEPARLEVKVDPSRSVVTGMVAHTRSGDVTRYRISETKFGVETSPADFEIVIPPGAERIGG